MPAACVIVAKRTPRARMPASVFQSSVKPAEGGSNATAGASTTYIMPLVIGDRSRMYRLGHELRRRGLWVAPVDYPAVPQDRICFRACVTANHTRADLDEALHILEETLVPELLQKA